MTQPHKLFLETEADTARLAKAFALHLRAGDTVLLSGGLAAGKTYFVQAAVAALGSDDPVSSPTYTLANIYSAPSGPIVHVDAYRLDSAVDFVDLALEDELELGVAFIEWGAMLAEEFDAWVALDLKPDADNETARDARLNSFGKRGAALLENALTTFNKGAA